jgi:DNA-binding response OmpR family regulator
MKTADPERPRGRILVVEDDAEAAYFAVHVLTTMGQFDVTHTFDPAVALRLAGSEPWDLVLTDVEMPGMTGLQLLEALRRVAPALPVAVITAHATDSPVAYTLRTNADEFLEKPVSPNRLIAVATALINRASEEQARHPGPDPAAGLPIRSLSAPRWPGLMQPARNRPANRAATLATHSGPRSRRT